MSEEPVNIFVVLDKSGSMITEKEDVLNAFNNFIAEQKQNTQTVLFTLVLFSDSFEYLITQKQITEISELNSDNYNPKGLTALYDTLDDLFRRFNDAKNPVCVIVTDGEDNCSKINRTSITDKIAELRDRNDNPWKFIYLCNDISLQLQAQNIGITPDRVGMTAFSSIPFTSLSTTLSSTVTPIINRYRTSSISSGLTPFTPKIVNSSKPYQETK